MTTSPLLLGHRGSRSSGSVEENTLPAFELALQHGCDGFEFDVRLTRDGHAVICHDETSRRIEIAEATGAQLAHLPRLPDVLTRFGQNAFLDIELKVPGLAPRVMDALREHPPQRGYVVSSFLPEVLSEVRTASNAIPLGIIFDRHLRLWQNLPVQYVIPHKSLVTREFVREARDGGKKIFAWTVNDPATMLQFAEWGIDGIISDKTDLLVATLRPR